MRRGCLSQMPRKRVEHEAKRAVTAVNEGDMLTTQMAVLKRFGKRGPVDTIALRRGVAACNTNARPVSLRGPLATAD